MPLSLIVGPPNSGRAGAIRAGLAEALSREPVLVVPTSDDVIRFEQELCRERNALIGVSARTFGSLFAEVAAATGAETPPSLTAAQRRRAVAMAAREAPLERLAAVARRPGFVPALDELIDELQAAGLDARSLEAPESEDRTYLAELGGVFRAYVELRDRLGRGDRHSLAAAATAALRAAPDAWGGRPVFLYGFDDLTGEQLELVSALAAAAPLSVAVTYQDRPALAARATLLARLRELGVEVERTLDPNPEHTRSETLFSVEQGLFEPQPRTIAPGPGLELLESAGERAEAERIAARIAGLLAAGEQPGEIAIALRSPERLGPLYEEVLAAAGIPAAVHAAVPLRRTAVGTGALALLRAAFASREARDVLAYLRTPGRAPPEAVDHLELAIRRRRIRDADRASWGQRPLEEVERLRGLAGSALLEEVAALARRLVEAPLRREAAVLDRGRGLEARAGVELARVAGELAELAELVPGPRELIEVLETTEVPLWHGSAEGRVHVVSPYRLRAGRFAHVFVASLQEGEFPRLARQGTFLSEEQRAEVGLPPRAASEDEERYLFYVCASRPTERLVLSWRSADGSGRAEAPSPFLAEVRELLDPPPPREPGAADELAERLIRRRGPGDVVLDPSEAPSEDELARALALRGLGAAQPPLAGALGLPDSLATPIAARLEAAAAVASELPGPLDSAAVIASLAERRAFGASTLEDYALCSYRWFVGHELAPETLDPPPEPLDHGSVIHEVLERLYRDPPSAGTIPRPETLAAWAARARSLLREVASSRGLDPDDARRRAGLGRMEALIDSYLGREAVREDPLRPRPELVEARFGAGDERPELDLGGFSLHGKIDRVDVDEAGSAGVVRDYKLSGTVTSAAKLESEGKLQLQLYMLALRELWSIEPLGAVYEPLGGRGGQRPRGPVRERERDGALQGTNLSGTDFLADDELEAVIARARERGGEVVAAMRAGRIARNPLHGRCPQFCEYQAICRRERGSAAIEEREGEEGSG